MASHFEDSFWQGNGSDELHRHMKNGTEFCKELENVFSDRAELENSFVKGLHKVIKKAKHSSKRCVNTMEPAWERLVALLEAEEVAHKNLANGFSNDCAKALKSFTDQQIKQREQLEASVDKQHKQFMERQSKQLKNKRTAFKTCRDLESSWEQLRSLRGANEKDTRKLEKTNQKLEDSLMKADREYKDSNLKTEQCRLAWEAAMYQCCRNNEDLEMRRLEKVQDMFATYTDLLQDSMPPLQTACQELVDYANQISPEADVEFACSNYGTGPNQPEQLLLDCYDEEMKNSMDGERRRASLERKIQYMEQEIERQQKARGGVEQLAKVYEEQPDFVDEKGANDVNRQLVEADCILNMLKANHYKLLSAHAETSNAPRPSSQFGEYISTTTDKHGQPVSMLKIPLEQIGFLEDDYQPAGYERSTASIRRKSTKTSLAANSYNGGAAYGGGGGGGGGEEEEEEEERVEDGFDDDDDGGYEYVGECTVLYEYTANETDELTIAAGDVIKIIDKYDVEWWQGELNGVVGIFPASYVEDKS